MQVPSPSLRTQALGAFRNLLRVRSQVFCGDTRTLRESRLEVRKHFAQHAHLTSPADIAQAVADAVEATSFLRASVVQAVRDLNTGKSTVRLGSEQMSNRRYVTMREIDEELLTPPSAASATTTPTTEAADPSAPK